MSTEQIAEVIADIREGTIKSLVPEERLRNVLVDIALRATNTVVDSTAIYDQLSATVEKYNYYDDHPSMAPPWDEAAICYVNQHGNVIVMAVQAIDAVRDGLTIEPWEPDPTDNKTIEWDRVRWILDVPLFIGGTTGGGQKTGTMGPAHLWRIAVYDTGEPADIRWMHVTPGYDLQNWDMALLVLLGTINFMGCRNVELVSAARTRSAQRRLNRIAPGISFGLLSVKPVGRASRGRTGANPGGLPMTSVVGHPVHYGDCCPGRHEPRGLLFGKLTGRFWVPQHARGQKELGEYRNDYVIRP